MKKIFLQHGIKALVFLFIPMMIVSCNDDDVPTLEEDDAEKIVLPITDVINTNLKGDIAVMGSDFDEATTYIFSRVQGQKHQINVGQTTLPETVKTLFIDQKSFDEMDVEYLDQIYEWYSNGVTICMHKPEMWTAAYIAWHLRWKELGMDVSVAELESKARSRAAESEEDEEELDLIALRWGTECFWLYDIYDEDEVYTHTVHIKEYLENGQVISRDSVVTEYPVEPTPFQYGLFAEETVKWLNDDDVDSKATRSSGTLDDPHTFVVNVSDRSYSHPYWGSISVSAPLKINVWASTMYNFERDEDYYSVVVEEDFDAAKLYLGQFFRKANTPFGDNSFAGYDAYAGFTWSNMEIRTRWAHDDFTPRLQYDILPQGKASPVVTEEISGWQVDAEVSIGLTGVSAKPGGSIKNEKKVTTVQQDVTLTNGENVDGNWMKWQYDFASQIHYDGFWGNPDLIAPPTNATCRSQSYQNQSWKWVVGNTRSRETTPFTFDLKIASMQRTDAHTHTQFSSAAQNSTFIRELSRDKNLFSIELPVPQRFKHIYRFTTDEIADIREYNQLMEALRQVSTNFNSLYNKLIRLDDEGNPVGRTGVTYDALRTMVGQEWYALAKEVQGKKIAVEKTYKFYVIDEEGNKLNMVKLEKGEYKQVGTYLVIAPDGVRIEEGTAGPDEGDVFTADVNGFSLTFKVTKKNEECRLVEVPSDYKGELVIPSHINDLKVSSVEYKAAYRRSGITSLKISGSMETIGGYAFSGIDITSLELPGGVLSLNHNAFMHCDNLKKIVLPASLESIGYGVFWDCYSIKEVHCKGKNPPKFDNGNSQTEIVEENVYENAVLYVPKGCKEKYKEELIWSQFNKIVEE